MFGVKKSVEEKNYIFYEKKIVGKKNEITNEEKETNKNTYK